MVHHESRSAEDGGCAILSSVRHVAIGVLATVLTGGAIASDRAARVDPPYDEDRVVEDLADHEFNLSDETDVTLPVVRCAEPIAHDHGPGPLGGVAVVLGLHHLGVEGREVMPLSANPTSDLVAHTSGTKILPLAAELEWQHRIARVAGRQDFGVNLYADESIPFSAARAVVRSTESFQRLVVREGETSRLRQLPLNRSPHHWRKACARQLVVEEHRVIDDDGVELLSLDGRTDMSALAAAVPIDWGVGLRVKGDVPLRVIVAILAVFEPSCAGGSHPIYVEMRSAEEIRSDPRVASTGRACTESVPVFGRH